MVLAAGGLVGFLLDCLVLSLSEDLEEFEPWHVLVQRLCDTIRELSAYFALLPLLYAYIPAKEIEPWHVLAQRLCETKRRLPEDFALYSLFDRIYIKARLY